MGIHKLYFAKGIFQPCLVRLLKGIGYAKVRRAHAQKACQQRPVGAVAVASVRKGAMQQYIRTDNLFPKEGTSHAAYAHRPRRM